jgi:hypothetical protein
VKNRGIGYPIGVDVLVFPHHGGLMGKEDEEESECADLKWFLSEAVNPRIAAISVGTSNPYGHPRRTIIDALKENKVRVMCTEATHGHSCNEERVGTSIIPPEHYSFCNRTLFPRNNHSIGCAGTIVATLCEDGIVVDREREHMEAVSSLNAYCVQK